MKLTNTQNMKAKSGMTLLELTVVILVLLSLISILFIGARAWKKGSDRSANILNIRNVQQAVRGYANMNGIIQAVGTTPGGAVAATTIFGAALEGVGGFLKKPGSVATVTYTTPNETNVLPGVFYLLPSTDGAAGADYGPTTGTTSEW